MMTPDLGLTFGPSARQGQAGGYEDQPTGIQQAIRVLSLRLPRTFGGAPAPAALLRSQGMAGLPMGPPPQPQGLANVGQGIPAQAAANPLMMALRRILLGGAPMAGAQFQGPLTPSVRYNLAPTPPMGGPEQSFPGGQPGMSEGFPWQMNRAA